MGISDYLWPFERKFSQVPCAREAAIAGLTGGIASGALVIVFRNRYLLAYKVSVYSGVGICWLSFSICRYINYQKKKVADQFKEDYSTGKFD